MVRSFGLEVVTGGISWVAVKNVNWDGQFSFIDSENGWAVARNLDDIALVYSTDGGQNWKIIEPTME